MSSGRYHHHIAANIWHSAGAGERDPERAGLSWLTFESTDGTAFAAVTERLTKAGVPLAQASFGVETADPWGTRLRIAPA